jgi:hypothetical protein
MKVSVFFYEVNHEFIKAIFPKFVKTYHYGNPD